MTYQDNQLIIALEGSGQTSYRTKYIEVRFHYSRDRIANDTILPHRQNDCQWVNQSLNTIIVCVVAGQVHGAEEHCQQLAQECLYYNVMAIERMQARRLTKTTLMVHASHFRQLHIIITAN